MTDEGRTIPIEIHGQRYPIRTSLEAEYVARLASYVEQKMQAAADSAPNGGDALRVAVLAALNVADELFRCRGAAVPATGNWPSGPRSSNACLTAS